jgi:hypothetical protein
MSLRVIHSFAQPFAFTVDPSATFSQGMIAQFYLYGNNIVCGVSDGTAPVGIIDDFKSTAFFAASVDEVIIAPAVGTLIGGRYISVADVSAPLRHPTISASNFVSDIPCLLNDNNGIVTFPAGTELNFDLDGDGIFDSIRSVSSYRYQITNFAGEDTTAGSNKLTIHYGRGFYETSEYEVSQRYPLNANLFCSASGLLTTSQYTSNLPSIAVVTAPPSSRFPYLQFLWL